MIFVFVKILQPPAKYQRISQCMRVSQGNREFAATAAAQEMQAGLSIQNL
jgi:hypothetical protein